MATATQPRVVSAQLESSGAVRVTYSEAMKPTAGVDPAKFRLTVAYYTRPASGSDKYKYSYGYYYQKGYGYVAHEHTIYSEAASIASLEADVLAPNQSVLHLGSFNQAAACKQIAAFKAANPGSQAGLYLHYSEAGTPTIEDEQGNKLQSQAAYWAADPTVEQVKGDFTGKPIPVAITCN